MNSRESQRKEAVAKVMRTGFGKDPYPWQQTAILKILESSGNRSSPTAHLLVRNTGGGKSLVRDTVAFILGGVALIITPLLVLGSDQTAKLKTMIQQGTGIEAVHLDEIGVDSQKEKTLITDIESLSSSTSKKTLLLFSSPQRLVSSKSWTECLSYMISNSLLKMVCVDEVHLYVMHGLHFRPQFFQLKDILFDKMKTYPIPVVFMTATATEEMIQNVKRLSGLSISRSNTNWPCYDGIQRRDVLVEVQFKQHVIRDFKELASDILPKTEFAKMILYTNSKFNANELAAKIREYLDAEDLPGDIVLIDGDLFKEQKFHNIKKFLHRGKIENPKDPSNRFDPRILIATSGAANAGIDSPSVYVVLHDGFPTSIEDLLQELGRAARRPALLTIATDRYRIDISLKSYVSLVKRIHREPSKDEVRGSDACMSAKEYRKHQMQNLDKVLKLLVLNTEQCLHRKLEYAASCL
jgi:superfamily II DNA helicase RecQ